MNPKIGQPTRYVERYFRRTYKKGPVFRSGGAEPEDVANSCYTGLVRKSATCSSSSLFIIETWELGQTGDAQSLDELLPPASADPEQVTMTARI